MRALRRFISSAIDIVGGGEAVEGFQAVFRLHHFVSQGGTHPFGQSTHDWIVVNDKNVPGVKGFGIRFCYHHYTCVFASEKLTAGGEPTFYDV